MTRHQKRTALAALLFDVALVLAVSVVTAGTTVTVAESAPAASAGTEGRQVVLYYFHGARRCKTCRTIEAFADEVAQSRFAKQIDSGELSWKVVNYDEAENEHFLEEFSLVSASLVLVEMNDGKPVRFEVLQKAWSLVRDKTDFQQYVHRSVLDFLG